MQAPTLVHRYPFTQFPPNSSLTNSSAKPIPLFRGRGGMDIGEILNARNQAAADAQLRHFQQQQQQQHHQMQMDAGAYAMSHHQGPTMAHQQPHHMPGLSYPNMGQPQHNPQLYASNYMTQQPSHNPMNNDDFGAMRPKNESAPKAFACSTCSKGFARRSDLARHGK